MDSVTLGGCKWISQRLCAVGFLSAFLNFHLFFFHLAPGLGPVLLGWINLNVITDNGKSQAQFWAISHNVTYANGAGKEDLKAINSPNHTPKILQCIQSQFKLKFWKTLGCLQLSQRLLQTSQKFLKTNQIFIQCSIKCKYISCKTLKWGFLTWVLQVYG